MYVMIALLLISSVAYGQSVTPKAVPNAKMAVTVPAVRLDVAFTGPGAYRDYIGVFPPGSNTYKDWVYTTGSRTRPPSGTQFPTSGSVSFTNLAQGKYDVKYCDASNKCGQASPVTIVFQGLPMTIEPPKGGSVSRTKISGGEQLVTTGGSHEIITTTDNNVTTTIVGTTRATKPPPQVKGTRQTKP